MTEPTYTIHNTDCVTGMADHLAPESVHHCVSSIPFGSLFSYSGKTEDIGNNTDDIDMRATQFGLHMRFAIEQLYRVLAPGSVACIHIQQLIATKVQHGYMGRRDFRGATIDLFTAGGFDWTGEFVIPKNPQVIAQRQKLHSLMFVTGKRDSRQLAPAVNDYVMVFRKPGEGTPVRALFDPQSNPGGWLSTEEWIRDAHGVWTDIRETDVLTGWRDARENEEEKHVCLATGSLVLTRDGYLPIEDVEVGAEVLTHQGRWRRVLAKANNGTRETVRLTAQGVADLRLTPDHQVWARSAKKQDGILATHARHKAMATDPDWMESSEALGSYLHLPLPPIDESPYSADEWWVLGRWLADGHIDTRGRLHISVSHDQARFDYLMARLGSRAGSVANRETAFQVAINDRDGHLRTMVSRCGRGASGKRVPGEALALNPDLAEALLSGYLSGDGHYVEQYDRWTSSSVSRALLLGMAAVAQRARGVVASVYAGRPAGTTEIEGRTVNTRQDWILVFRNSEGYRQSGWIDEAGSWKKVRHVENAGESEVWDLQVEEDESFVAEGAAVHNCPLQLEVIRRCIRLYSNAGDTVLDPFMGIGSTAVVAIEQGRNAVGFELKESYHRQAVANCERALEKRRVGNTLPLFDLAEVAS